jgi:hypothetical protein
MHMKKAAVYEDYFPPASEYQIRLPREIFTMQAVAIPHGVDQGADNHLRSRIPASDARHIVSPLVRGQNIRHVTFLRSHPPV